MKPEAHHIPLACGLSGVELREREATLLAKFKSGVIATEELSDGYAFRLAGDAKWIALVAELIVAERECCPFLTFELAAQPDRGPLIFRAFGPAGAKAFLKTILCIPESSAQQSGWMVGNSDGGIGST
jgi:hypothetical protein